MKNIQTLLILLISGLLLLAGCEESPVNPGFNDNDIPRILYDWQSTYTLRLNDSLVILPQVSPSDGATYEWTLNGDIISTQKDLRYKFTIFGQYVLVFTVTRNTVTNSRTAQVAIQKAAFEPKTYTKKVIGFIGPDAKLEDIQWDKITHLVISSARVNANGIDTVLNANDPTNREMKKIIFMAYNYGVYVLLDLTGTISNYIIGEGPWGDLDFYTLISDPAQRDKLISDVTLFMKNNKFDGLNIYLNNTSLDGPFDAPTVNGFFDAMYNNLPQPPMDKDKMYLTASVPGGWTWEVLSMLATNANIDWINVRCFGLQDLAPTHSSPYWFVTDRCDAWHNWYGVPYEKLIVGLPAFGIQYNIPEGVSPTWGDIDTYTTWTKYKDILALNPDAYNLNPNQFDVTSNTGVFYDGFQNIDDKTAYVLNNDLGGVMMWGIENDTQDPAASILKRTYDDLNGSK